MNQYFCKKKYMLNILNKSHSGLRWVVLILLIYAIVNAFNSKSKNKYEKRDKMINLFAMISLHVQLIIGLILYFLSPKVVFPDGWMKISQARFFGLEHILLMIIAIAIVTIGRKKAEKENVSRNKHAKIAVWYLIGLILIFASIPWPFRNLGVTTWF
jgi:uncharacterized membrane protein YozB (DUF420 family)